METTGAGQRGLPTVGHKEQKSPCGLSAQSSGFMFLLRYSSLELHLVAKLQPGLSRATEGSSGPESGPHAGQPRVIPAVCGGGNVPKAE